MIRQRTVAAPGLRTASRPGLRALIGRALAAPGEEPMLWLLGTLSFVLRGGVVLLLAPIVVLPTQVEVRLMLGGNLGSTGLSAGFWVAVAVGTVVTTGVALAVLYALARIELAAYRRLSGNAELVADFDVGSDARTPRAAADRGGLFRALFVVEALTVVALLLAAVPLAATVGQATLDEILLPSSAASIYVRVLGHLTVPLAIFLGALPVIDSVSALVVRQLLLGRSVGAGLRGMLAVSPGVAARAIASALIGWLCLIVVVLAVDWALSVAWQAARASFLATTSVSDTLGDPVPLLVAVMLSGVFVAGLALAGYTAAFRAALWSVTSLRR